MRFIRPLAGELVLIEMTAQEWHALGATAPVVDVPGTVDDLYARLPAGAISARTWLTLQRYGIARQPAKWLLSQLSGINNLLAAGRSLDWIYAQKRRLDRRVPEIVYCPNLGLGGLREVLRAFDPLVRGDHDHTD